MSDDAKDDSAFPRMPLRDYFAAKAMGAILTALTSQGGAQDADAAEPIAMASYAMADAMLKARQS